MIKFITQTLNSQKIFCLIIAFINKKIISLYGLGNSMKDKIVKKVQEWYDQNVDKDEVFFEEFVDIVINNTADVIFEEIKDGFKEEFNKGNLKHPFVISPEYYLYLKLKEIKEKCVPSNTNDESFEE